VQQPFSMANPLLEPCRSVVGGVSPVAIKIVKTRLVQDMSEVVPRACRAFVPWRSAYHHKVGM
jgi:hypothetical protein